MSQSEDTNMYPQLELVPDDVVVVWPDAAVSYCLPTDLQCVFQLLVAQQTAGLLHASSVKGKQMLWLNKHG